MQIPYREAGAFAIMLIHGVSSVVSLVGLSPAPYGPESGSQEDLQRTTTHEQTPEPQVGLRDVESVCQTRRVSVQSLSSSSW